MDNPTYSSDIAFTPTVKQLQDQRGSRATYRRMEERGGWRSEITPELADFIAAQDSLFLGTSTADGQPYIQHRGGPPGFVQVLDARTLAFADYRGNRQFISTGNLADNPKAYLMLIDYARRRRFKLWGTARMVSDDPELLRRLMPAGYDAEPEQALVFSVAAWDANCPQHIPQRFAAAEVASALATRDRRIAELEAELASLRRDTAGS